MLRYYTVAALTYLLQTHFHRNPGRSSFFVRAHEDEEEHSHARTGSGTPSAWAYLDTDLPVPMSDMAVSLMTFPGFGANRQRIVITGGCNDPNGNVLAEIDLREFGIDNCGENCVFETFQCTSLSSKAFAFDPTPPSDGDTHGYWDGSFEELPEMPRKRARHANASVVVGGKHLLCVLGGRDESDTLIAEIDCYDPEANTWSTPASLPSALQTSDCTAVATSNEPYIIEESDTQVHSSKHETYTHNPTRIHLIGGYDADYIALSSVTSIDMSDLSNVQFSSGPSLLTERGDIDSVILRHHNGEEFVYVSGGFTHTNDYAMPHNTVEKIALHLLASTSTSSTTAGAWSDVGTLIQERGDKQLVTLNGRIYALGGETRVDPVAATPEEEIYALGDKSAILDTVEVYVPGLEDDIAWERLADMPVALHRFAASEWEVDGAKVIFVFGGQVGYDADCECFRTTDKVLAFQPEIAEMGTGTVEAMESEGSGGVSWNGGAVGTVVTLLSGLLWLVM